ncbi:MAG: hypothetical protein OEN02_04155 [Gammaproteobacteria bacterium]|nr:hypothetical protein [Gammaproteobacteria bacterium]MDH3535671.1 hypothetical protein [Gammaproteobacteria bacterium]
MLGNGPVCPFNAVGHADIAAISKWSKSALVVIPLIATGCNVVNIDVDDSVNFSDFETSAPLPDQDHLRIRLRGSTANGEYGQFVVDGELIRINDTPLFGPREVSGTADVSYFSIALGEDYTTGELAPGELGVQRYVGIAQTSLDFTLQDAGTTYSLSDTTTEIYLQIGAVYALSKRVNFGLGLAGSWSIENSGITEIELSLDYRIIKQLKLDGGYRWFEYSYGEKQDDSNDSAIDLDFKGPFLGLILAFD